MKGILKYKGDNRMKRIINFSQFCMKDIKDTTVITEKDIEIAKSIDGDFRLDCFQVDEDELYYLNGYDYPKFIRRVKNDNGKSICN